MSLKAQARRIAYRLLRHSGALERERKRRVSSGAGWATVLVFHSTDPNTAEDGLNISPGRFRRIVEMLARRYDVLSLDELVRRLSGGVPLTGREVVITFDDGYLDNYAHAAPALADVGLPATFFLTAGYVGTDRRFFWDVEKGIHRPMMSWDQARELAGMGFQIGCHTWSHADLGTEPLSSVGNELDRARKTLQDRTGDPICHFAYPFGGRANIRPEWVDAIRSAGFDSNSSAIDEPVLASSDVFMIPRLGAAPQRSLEALRIDIDLAW